MSWDFVWITSNDSVVTAEADFFATHISTTSPSGVISRGADLILSKNSGRFNASGWSTQTSPEDHRYMEIAINPDNGYQINIDSIVFNFQRNLNGPKYLAIRSSEDNFASDLAVFDSIETSNNGLKAVLSGFISITNNVTFRFYGYNAAYTTGNGGFEGTGDDIILYGSVESAINFDTEIQAPVTQIPGDTISTHRNIESLAKDVFTFNVADQGTTDGQPTIITNIRVVPNTTNTADWTDHIQGVTLNDGSLVTIGTPVITDTYIDIPVPSGNLNIADGTNQDVTLGIYFNPTNLIEGEILSFMIDASDHGCTADASGSQFAPTFAGGDFNSANFSIEVVPTKITITVQPSLVVVNRIMSPAVVAGFSDDNGNIDLDAQTEEIRIVSSGVTLSGSSNTIGEIQSDGLAYFSDLAFTNAGSGTLTFDDVNGYAGSIPDEVSDAFDVIGASESVIIAEASSESSGISSIINDTPISDNTEGVQVWQFRLYDGDGTLSDNDGLPTNFVKIRITKGTGNTVSDWSTAIEDVQFFADASSTPIAGTITAYNDSISFVPTSGISVSQGAGSNVLITMRLSLVNPLPSGSDGQQFVFEIQDTNVLTSNGYTSSNPGVFTATSDNTPSVNSIDVTSTEVSYQQQPTDVTVSQNIDPAVVVSLTDANGNIDLGFENSIIQITSTGSTLNNSPVDQAIDASGLATFGSIQLMDVASGVTLTATDRDNVMGLGSPAFVVSDPFNVTPSSSSVVQAVALSEPDTISSMIRLM
jgi:hypothetical protein